MKKGIYSAVVASFVLAGCALHDQYRDQNTGDASVSTQIVKANGDITNCNSHLTTSEETSPNGDFTHLIFTGISRDFITGQKREPVQSYSFVKTDKVIIEYAYGPNFTAYWEGTDVSKEGGFVELRKGADEAMALAKKTCQSKSETLLSQGYKIINDVDHWPSYREQVEALGRKWAPAASTALTAKL